MSDTPPPPVLEMRGIRKEFPGVVALDGVDLTLEAGDIHMLLGENGAGKSTLMKILGGAYRKDAGEIRMNGRPVEIDSPRAARDLGIRVIYQELNLVPHLSVAENIFLGELPTYGGRRVQKDPPYVRRPGLFRPGFPGLVDWRALHDRTSALLLDLGMTLDPRAPVGQLGMAQRQMVEIAKALASPASAKASARQARDASILVMDEPTSSLTSREVTQLFALIDRLTSRGVSIVYITHRLDEVFRIGRRITVMRDGRRVTTTPIDQVTVTELVRMMANRDLSEHFPKVRVEPGPELLRVEALTVDGVLADISFSLRAGEVLGISGLLGAGRTELARVVAGADRFDRGRLVVDGTEARFRHPADAISASHRRESTPSGANQRGAAREGDAHAAGASAERRQPAEGGARQMARRLGPHLHLRRADARRRCRREGGDLQPDEPPDRPWRRHHHDLLGAARAARHERPHFGDAPRPDSRRDRGGGCDRRARAERRAGAGQVTFRAVVVRAFRSARYGRPEGLHYVDGFAGWIDRP